MSDRLYALVRLGNEFPGQISINFFDQVTSSKDQRWRIGPQTGIMPDRQQVSAHAMTASSTDSIADTKRADECLARDVLEAYLQCQAWKNGHVSACLAGECVISVEIHANYHHGEVLLMRHLREIANLLSAAAPDRTVQFEVVRDTVLAYDFGNNLIHHYIGEVHSDNYVEP